MVEPAVAWEQDGIAAGKGRALMGAVDETFLEQMILILMDVPTGSLRLAEVAAARPCATWKARVDKRLEVLGPWGLSLVRERAKALMQRAATGLEGRSRPEVFHVPHALVKSAALALGRRWRQAHKAREPAQAVLESPPVLAPVDDAGPGITAAVEAKRAEGTRWEEVRAACDQHASTERLAPQVLADGPAWATEQAQALQRAASAVEGRNGARAQRHHHQRGWPKPRDTGWTVLQNCDGRAADGPTPAACLFGRSFLDLFATVLSPIEAVPRPRPRNRAGVLRA